MNIIIPMAGKGNRTLDFSSIPKPLIEINNHSMIEYVVKTLNIKGQYIFITRKYDNEDYNIKLNNILNNICDKPIIININYITDGPASSALLAKDFIKDDKLIIANCDQILNWNSNVFLEKCNSYYDGLVITQKLNSIKNSYIKLDENDNAICLAEKEIISEYALTGIHYWKNGNDFITSCEEMINHNDRYNNEFYISKTYNYLINKGKKIGIHNIGLEENFATGTTNDILNFLKNASISI